MCRQVLVTMPSSCEIVFKVMASPPRPSNRRMAIDRVTAGTARTRGPVPAADSWELASLIWLSDFYCGKHTLGALWPVAPNLTLNCIYTINRRH
ncbi:hypothetical protein D3C85_1061230 [compost metagenome]